MIQSNNLIYTYNNLNNVLNKEEFIYLINEMKKGNDNARKKIIEHNLKLVIFEVNHKFKTVNYDTEDLISIGIIGLTKAIDTFNIDKNYEFSTYAIRCIDNEIYMFLRHLNKINSIDSLDRIIAVHNDSLNLTINDIIADVNDIQEEYNNKEIYEIVRNIIYKLPEKEREIILLSFGFYNNKIYTQKEIAHILNSTQSSISRLKNKILYNISITLKELDIIEEKDINNKIKKLYK